MARECFNPVSIVRPNGNGVKDRMLVPCGTCPACDLNRIEDFKTRALYEFKHSDNAFFVTLTYDDDHLPYDENYGVPVLKKRDYQLFLKRFRRQIEKDNVIFHSKEESLLKWRKLRYILCGEYGPLNERPHFHAIIFNIPIRPGIPALGYVVNLVDTCWRLGHIKVGLVEGGAIDYVCSYILGKRRHKFAWQSPFLVSSRRPGIGYEYVTNMKQWHGDRDQDYLLQLGEGKVKRMPRYLADKIFSPETKAKIGDEKYKFSQEADRLEFEDRFQSDGTRYLSHKESARNEALQILKKKEKSKSKV